MGFQSAINLELHNILLQLASVDNTEILLSTIKCIESITDIIKNKIKARENIDEILYNNLQISLFVVEKVYNIQSVGTEPRNSILDETYHNILKSTTTLCATTIELTLNSNNQTIQRNIEFIHK